MPKTPMSLADLFFEHTGATGAVKTLEATVWPELEAKIAGAPNLDRSVVTGEIEDALLQALDVGFIDVFTSAWIKLKELQPYRDRKAHPPSEVAMVPLAKHSIRSTHRPAIEILLGERRILELVFDVALELQLDGFILKIQDGRILEIASGRFKGKGSLKYGGATLIAKETPAYSLPGRIALDSAVPIPEISVFGG